MQVEESKEMLEDEYVDSEDEYAKKDEDKEKSESTITFTTPLPGQFKNILVCEKG
jgi:hypothetical protein